MKSLPDPLDSCHRPRGKNLGVPELIAIALGGMIGGGIFSILGISVSMVGAYAPLAIAIGGVIAAMAAYSYIKLGILYKDEGATYAFFKRTYPTSPLAASFIGWWVIFGYISTMALYAYTFAAYAISSFPVADSEWVRKIVAGTVILFFTLINVWSVKGMGRLEDLMVYTKLIILVVISFVLINNSSTTLPALVSNNGSFDLMAILIAASITFVAYEGFQLVINATNEMEQPEKNIPRAIYAAVFLATAIYVVISLGAVLAIPFSDLIENKEYALAAGTNHILGNWGTDLIIIGALLATSSAISGTLFGASRQMAVIAEDGYFPAILSERTHRIPRNAIMAMSLFALLLILAGNLRQILEFGSVTFLLVSLLMACANFKKRESTGSSTILTLLTILGLTVGTFCILYFEAIHQPEQLFFILGIYIVLSLGAWAYAKSH
ncbi:MAG: APC family permease, partial [Mariprofundaceae bacterium]|nr:APC family permease [Mariprofundaceae bacterium]